MELTGSLYQDFTALKNTYERYGWLGSYVLTRDEDTIFQIMLQMTLADLSAFCQTNKIANALCHDKDFWTFKFKQDDLPIIKPFAFDTNYIQEYQLTKTAQDDAKRIIKIEDVESQRDKTKWQIRINTSNFNDIPIRSVLRLLNHKDINKMLDVETRKISVVITKRLKPFELFIFYDHCNYHDVTRLLSLQANYEYIVFLFTIILRYYDDVLITDTHGPNLLITQDYLNNLKRRLPQRYKQDRQLLIKRMGIYDSLKYTS